MNLDWLRSCWCLHCLLATSLLWPDMCCHFALISIIVSECFLLLHPVQPWCHCFGSHLTWQQASTLDWCYHFMGMDTTIREKQPYPYCIFPGWRSEYSKITYLANQGYLSKHTMMKIFMKLHIFFKGIFWMCPLMSWFSVTRVGGSTSAISQSGHDRVHVVDGRDYYLFIEHLHSIWWSFWQPISPIG